MAYKVAQSALQRDLQIGLTGESLTKYEQTSFPRDNNVENPWHIMDFSKFIEYAASRPRLTGEKFGYISDKHFAPYYSIKPMSPCNIQYDVIIKQEFLGDELGEGSRSRSGRSLA